MGASRITWTCMPHGQGETWCGTLGLAMDLLVTTNRFQLSVQDLLENHVWIAGIPIMSPQLMQAFHRK